MVYFHGPVSVDEHKEVAKSVNSIDPYLKVRQINQLHRNKRNSGSSPNHLNIPACEQSRSAIIDVVISIAVIGACVCLLYPYAMILACKTLAFGEEVVDVMTEEIDRAPVVFCCLGLGVFFAAMALAAIALYTDRRCGKRGCRGLRKSAAEFDIQLETEDCVKLSTCVVKSSLKKGLFQLPRDHHRELESELKKMAPANGRAVLVLRARCGCSVGRMEVRGPRKFRKVKK